LDDFNPETYNGRGDRLQQTVDGVATNYVLDLNAGLTQVLSDGTSQYLYGLGRVGEYVGGQWAYYATDALGSVRQIVDGSGEVQFYQSYEPYGDVLDSSGTAESNYGFAGEWTDLSGLIYLRSRYYDVSLGRLITRDPFSGITTGPASLNR
jgi:RHS repeat-associated protein